MIDLLFLTWNRKGFTETTLPMLLANTDWSLVTRLLFYDDNSADGTRRLIQDTMETIRPPVPWELRVTPQLRSPVRTMQHYLDLDPAPMFAKIDNDIVVPPGWLPRMHDVMIRYPMLELLGMEAGMAQGAADYPPPPSDPLALTPGSYTFAASSHIGGVGLMRASAFLDRPRMKAMGRFGFTEWQHTLNPVRGWIAPDLLTCDLSKRPGQPWEHLSFVYVVRGWQRPWPTQHNMDTVYWDWWDRAKEIA